jgi:hypothetical protein
VFGVIDDVMVMFMGMIRIGGVVGNLVSVGSDVN